MPWVLLFLGIYREATKLWKSGTTSKKYDSDCKDASGRLCCGAAWSKPERRLPRRSVDVWRFSS